MTNLALEAYGAARGQRIALEKQMGRQMIGVQAYGTQAWADAFLDTAAKVREAREREEQLLRELDLTLETGDTNEVAMLNGAAAMLAGPPMGIRNEIRRLQDGAEQPFTSEQLASIGGMIDGAVGDLGGKA